MPTDRWRRLEQLFVDASAQPAAIRAEYLAVACGQDAALADEVTSLLRAAEESGDFLSAPALDVFAREISRDGWNVRVGERVGAYVIERRLGAGGMGEVWRARDERLGRHVAIKFLLPHPSDATGRLQAFEREARAAGALNHPNVLTVHDVGAHGDVPYLVTECLEGESLRTRLDRRGLSIDAALDLALQTVRGLGAAHERGIVHRDLKPENLFLVADGGVKILDFGLATLHDVAPLPMGTAAYMAPEQVRGETADARADIYSFGTVLHEMLAGRRPSPVDLTAIIPAVPPALARIVARCLAPSPDERFATVASLESALRAIAAARSVRRRTAAFLRQPLVVTAAVVVIASIAIVGWRWRVSAARGHWARTVAVSEAERLATHGDYASAFLVVRDALEAAPDDPRLRQLWLDVSVPVRVSTNPEGADVAIAPYRKPARWVALGRTPLVGVRVPRTLIRVRVVKAGFQTIEGTGSPPGMRFRLDPSAAVPTGMVRVVGGRTPVASGRSGELADFWIARFEVTNRQFKRFVDQGGYRRKELWREPFVRAGRAVSWADAMDSFVDATGAPGPAQWRAGRYPEDQDDFPVGGVSWYEAAAYAVFAGDSLPTVHHWYLAASLGRFADILTVSNFSGTGPAAVGSYDGLGPFGTCDMAGNVREWSSTATGASRFLLGGAWDEPRYSFANYEARPPFERAPEYGFRLAHYDQPLPPAVAADVEIDGLVRDGRSLRPAGDAIFEVMRRQYAYDKIPLNALVEATETTDAWVREIIAVDAAYGGERMRVHLFRPTRAVPPYQTVIFFPAGDAFGLDSSRDMSLAWVDFIIRSGRAVLYPIYKGTYERAIADLAGPNARRELGVAWSRDLGRAIDYLETRSDIDLVRLGFYGVSVGADAGVFLTALEPRLKVSVLQSTGIWGDDTPESDAFNYAPRVRMPTLMLNGRYDFIIPFETAQRPLFNLLGPRAQDKRHVAFESGHALATEDVVREALPWLDRYLGPATMAPPRARR